MNRADGNSGFGWMLVIGGLVIVGIGLIWVLAPNLPRLGRLPGDIVIDRQNSRFYFPIVTCIVLSVVLSLVMWVIRAMSGNRKGLKRTGWWGRVSGVLKRLRPLISIRHPIRDHAPNAALRFRRVAVSPGRLGIRWIWACMTVCPASSPQFIPTNPLPGKSSITFLGIEKSDDPTSFRLEFVARMLYTVCP